jgi:nucleoside-diphosphate-sugar epimerase/2-polyprenyl-3-methyl-5-hydroxy-6-metoxy-1,4-benzoquinol methylase
MKVLITGGTGFIGSRLALRCFEKGQTVRILGQENNNTEETNRRLVEQEGAEVLLGSVTEREKVREALQDVNVVYHLAAAQHEANVPDQVFWDVNVTGTRNLLEESLNVGVKRFVYGSTIGVYGSALDGELDEDAPPRPANIYGITKLEAEKVVQSYKDNLPAVIIRISETYGPGDRRLLKLFRLINKNAFFMIGNGKNLHHPIYIDDLIDGLLLAAKSEEAVGNIFVLPGKDALTTNDMVAAISEVLEASGAKFRAPLFPFLTLATILETVCKPFGIQPPLHRRRMDFFRKTFVFAGEKSRNVLKFSPKFTFKEGALETARWYASMGYLESTTVTENKHNKLSADSEQVFHDADIEHNVGNVLKYPHKDNKTKTDSNLTAKMEAFDTFWEAPKNIDKGYKSFGKFYKRNYFKYVPRDKNITVLVISCGPGYFVNLLNIEGYRNVLGIDSDPKKVNYAVRRGLNCRPEHIFSFLEQNEHSYDFIFAEQEINHLTKEEILQFLKLCADNLREKGILMVHSLNGANPITGAEALAQNFDHFNTFTEYSLRQILEYSNFGDIKVIPLKLYIFYKNPLNYIGMFVTSVFELFFRFCFILYGKSNRIFAKKIAAICKKVD